MREELQQRLQEIRYWCEDWDFLVAVKGINNIGLILDPTIWPYVFAKNSGWGCPWLLIILCRLGGHPRGNVWFTQDLEPDRHCKTCGDDLG